MDGLWIALIVRCIGVRRVRHDEHILRSRMGILYGRVRGLASLSVLLGLDAGPEAVPDGDHLPLVRPVRRRGLRGRVRSTLERCENGCNTGDSEHFICKLL
uniref:(northern house mosquito) hypothetical protein n=1 Tax=Culex pipiens TaxID=7175 RepID=A0A8D8DIU9_CULPI